MAFIAVMTTTRARARARHRRTVCQRPLGQTRERVDRPANARQVYQPCSADPSGLERTRSIDPPPDPVEAQDDSETTGMPARTLEAQGSGNDPLTWITAIKRSNITAARLPMTQPTSTTWACRSAPVERGLTLPPVMERCALSSNGFGTTQSSDPSPPLIPHHATTTSDA